MIAVRFMSLVGKFATVREERFSTTQEALAAVRAYCEPAGYTSVKIADDNDCGELRFTARTPGGRGGRNVAFGDFVGGCPCGTNPHFETCPGEDPWGGF